MSSFQDQMMLIFQLQKEIESKNALIEHLENQLGSKNAEPLSPIESKRQLSHTCISGKSPVICSKCNGPVVNEIKADPFFTGILVCQECRKKGKFPDNGLQLVQKHCELCAKDILPLPNCFGSSKIDYTQRLCNECTSDSKLKTTLYAKRCCNKCSTSSTSKWYTDRIKPGHICKSCYTKRRQSHLFDGIEKARMCEDCGHDSSIIWYQNAFSPSGYICGICHQKRKRLKTPKTTI